MSKFKPTPLMVSAAETVFLAMAALQIIEPTVTGYKRKILEQGQWRVKPEYVSRLGDHVITDPERSYLMAQDNMVIYFERCNQARDAAGLYVDHNDKCPLLVAKSTLATAEYLLIQTMQETMKMTDSVLNGLSPANRKTTIELILKLLAPYVSKEHAMSSLHVKAP